MYTHYALPPSLNHLLTKTTTVSQSVSGARTLREYVEEFLRVLLHVATLVLLRELRKTRPKHNGTRQCSV